MTPRKSRPFRNTILNRSRDPHPALPPRKKRTMNRVQYAGQCRSMDQADDQALIDALLDEHGIGTPQTGAVGDRIAALERLVIALARDGRPVPFATRKRGSRPVADLLPFMADLADFVEAARHGPNALTLLAACQKFRAKRRDKRTARYLADLYREYRSHVKRGPDWLRQFIAEANADLAARNRTS